MSRKMARAYDRHQGFFVIVFAEPGNIPFFFKTYLQRLLLTIGMQILFLHEPRLFLLKCW